MMEISDIYASNFSLERFIPDISIYDLAVPPTPPEIDYKLNERHYSVNDISMVNDNFFTLKNLENIQSTNVGKNDIKNKHSFESNKKLKSDILDYKNPNYIYLFFSYSLDSEAHYKNVIKLKKELECFPRFKVIMDAFEQKELAEDMYHWMNTKFEAADFIIPILSPLYKHSTEKLQNIANNNDHTKQTRYIFGLMQREIYEGSFKNKRIRPLVISNANQIVSKEHVPNIFSNTLIYEWPRDNKEFLMLLQKS